MKKYDVISGGEPVKLDIKSYKERRATAYAAGQFNNPNFAPIFVFEQEAHDKAIADEATVKTFLTDPEDVKG